MFSKYYHVVDLFGSISVGNLHTIIATWRAHRGGKFISIYLTNSYPDGPVEREIYKEILLYIARREGPVLVLIIRKWAEISCEIDN